MFGMVGEMIAEGNLEFLIFAGVVGALTFGAFIFAFKSR